MMKATLVLVVTSFISAGQPGSNQDRLYEYGELPFATLEECSTALPQVAKEVRGYYSEKGADNIPALSPTAVYYTSTENFHIQLDCYPGAPKVREIDIRQFMRSREHAASTR
jgi:hypothetical protein